ncbi:MAG TPA: hypothetical protein VLX92_33490 [Kofleriaceae bacterium]|nr:hypothetical protein [Kofleriaceae bacterium]
MSRNAVLCVLVACGDPSVTITPVVDLPVNDNASAFPLDQLTLEVAHAGSTVDLTSATFSHGQVVQVAGVPFADDLVVHMTGFTGASEEAYGRTCEFAATADGASPAPHVLFSRSVKFAQLAVTPDLRIGGTSVTYHDGSAIIVGGTDPADNTPQLDVEHYDPRTNSYDVVGTLDNTRTEAIATLLGTGDAAQVVVIGGIVAQTNSGASFIELIEADDPDPDRRIQKVINGNTERIRLTATPLSDGTVIVIGGQDPSSNAAVGEVDQITLANGTATVAALQASLGLGFERYDHTATRLGDDVGAPVLIAGGVGNGGLPVAQAELFNPLSQTISTPPQYTMVAPRSQHQAVRMPDGSVLIIGGVDAMGLPVTQLELFTLENGFTAVGTLPADAGTVGFTLTTLPDGRVLMTGGRAPGGTALPTAFIISLDPIGGQVDIVATDVLDAMFGRFNHNATLLCDGSVLISGGTATLQPLLRYNPAPAGRR